MLQETRASDPEPDDGKVGVARMRHVRCWYKRRLADLPETSIDPWLGIFGRAMQFGVPVIVRRGSLIERVAAATPLSVIKVDFADKNGLADALRAPWPRKLDESQMVAHAGKIGSWRQEFIRGLEKVLEFSRPLDDI